MTFGRIILHLRFCNLLQLPALFPAVTLICGVAAVMFVSAVVFKHCCQIGISHVLCNITVTLVDCAGSSSLNGGML